MQTSETVGCCVGAPEHRDDDDDDECWKIE